MNAGPRAIYLTHPEVVIDPDVAVPDWPLSPAGAARVTALAARLEASAGGRVISSAERKALEAAWPLAARLGVAVEVRPQMHENDRSATGFLPGPEFEVVVDAFFADPDMAVRGWETARAAQRRILAEFNAVIAAHSDVPLILTGHGGVGTLLYCALAGVAIDRRWDQPAAGSWFAIDLATRQVLNHWQPIETLRRV